MRDVREKSDPFVYFSSVCIFPLSARLFLTSRLLLSSEHVPVDVSPVPPRRAPVQPAISVHAQFPRLSQVDPRMGRSRNEGEGAVEGPRWRQRFGEAAGEEEGVRQRLEGCQERDGESRQSRASTETRCAQMQNFNLTPEFFKPNESQSQIKMVHKNYEVVFRAESIKCEKNQRTFYKENLNFTVAFLKNCYFLSWFLPKLYLNSIRIVGMLWPLIFVTFILII